MSVFRNLNTVRKLMFAFGTVGAIIAGLGYFGINTVSTVNDIVAILYERELKGLSAIKDVNLAITGISRLTRAAIISTDQKEKEQFNKTIGQLKEQFQNKLSEFQKLTITDEAKTIAVELERIFPPYMELMEEAVRLTLRDDNVNAIKKVHDAIPDAQQVMSKASELAVMKEKQAEKVYRESNVLYERSRNIMAGLTVVGVGLGVMLGWVISQMIGRSLAHLGKVVSKLESGDLTARAAVESTDEVGQLAQSFNKMGEQLEHIVKNQEQEIASKVAEVKGLLMPSANHRRQSNSIRTGRSLQPTRTSSAAWVIRWTRSRGATIGCLPIRLMRHRPSIRHSGPNSIGASLMSVSILV